MWVGFSRDNLERRGHNLYRAFYATGKRSDSHDYGHFGF